MDTILEENKRLKEDAKMSLKYGIVMNLVKNIVIM
jgi:hypothetical protein